MPIPSGLTTITVTSAYPAIDGAPQTGTVLFETLQPIMDATGKVKFTGSATRKVIFGVMAPLVLPCTDNTSLNPTGFTYKITETLNGVQQTPYWVSLPSTLGATVDLSAVTPATATTGATAVVTGPDGHLASGMMPRPTLYAPTGLRRWRAALGDSLFSQVPIVCIGDSIAAGQGGDNINTFSNVPDNSNGWAGQLRAMFANRQGSYPGEGFWLASDSRVTWTGGLASGGYACLPLRTGPRLLAGAGTSMVLTIPDSVTTCGIIQANQTLAFNTGHSNLADVTALYSQTGSATVTSQPVTTLTNTGLPIETDIAVQPGDTITLTPPATAQSYIVGFNMKTVQPGVLVHRVAVPGFVSGDLLGGQTNGVLNNTGVNITYAERACYYWANTGLAGLVIVSFGTNDQQFQQGGSGGSVNGVTLPLYTAWMQAFCTQAIADGWCCLILGQPRNSSPGAGATLDQYWAAMESYATSTDHVAFMDVGELWGAAPAPENLGLLAGSSSIHPSRRGHGDIARMLYRSLTDVAGITELNAA